ncbi:MAG: DUF2341 domain-containing protein [Methylococcaceae bacterium]|nr:MAG: DUF2341 domain-containing protein [Methylococcaceae bacterium]
MKVKKYTITWLTLALLLFSNASSAWWSNDWKSRKELTLDGSATGADIKDNLAQFPLLLRLHTANFGFFADLADNGKDLRFVLNDQVPLKYHIESFDKTSEVALIWINLPQFSSLSNLDQVFLYYGNEKAPAGDDVKATYDSHQVLLYHYKNGEPKPVDATSYGNNAQEATLTIEPGGQINGAARFDGNGRIHIAANPALSVNPDNGWTFSTWIKVEQPQTATLLEAKEEEYSMGLRLMLDNGNLVLRYDNGHGIVVDTEPQALEAGKWQHLAVAAKKDGLVLYLNGAPVKNVAIELAPMNPTITIGAAFNGLLDETGVANVARSPDWIKALARSQSADFNVVGFGADETNEGGGGYIGIIMKNVTLDGWLVIIATMLMGVVAVMVIVFKTLLIIRVNKDNRDFINAYHELDKDKLTSLDRDETEDDKDLGDSPVLMALMGTGGRFQNSSFYHVYHYGIRELKRRTNDYKKPITLAVLNGVKLVIDAELTRESQRLGKNMVLLTIAISGGPFLGLLGTVVGTMITFAAIAATGDVNINAIAPGIAAALAATVAGLLVAIPALFAYNYLTTQIKDILVEMNLFADEFVHHLSEQID